MLLKSFTRKIVRAECNPSFESVHCIAHLDQDIEPVLPYLNTVLGGFEYLMDDDNRASLGDYMSQFHFEV